MSDSEAVKEQVRRHWAAQAARWSAQQARMASANRAVTAALLAAARVGPGLRVLDLASGAGEPALTLAEVVGPGGRVTATDLAPEMLAGAEELARERGLTNIAFRQADAEALPFPDASFDRVTCRLGVMFFPDLPRALGEARRVLVPDGLVALLVWGPFERNPAHSATTGVLRRYLPAGTGEPPVAGVMFKYAESGMLAAALRAAGFRDVMEEARALTVDFESTADDYWRSRAEPGSQLDQLLTRVPPEQREEAITAALAALHQYERDGHLVFPAAVNIATGRR